MTPQHWQRIEVLFQAALEHQPEARIAYLKTACVADDNLYAELEALLLAHEKASNFIEKPAFKARAFEPSRDLHADADEQANDLAGRRIGSYRILREIGRGGMGAVFLATRDDDEYQKQVAIKLIKRGMDTDLILRRFKNERQILASLEHPHIARLIDGGSTVEGLPYLVMEYVEGTPIDSYCDQKKLSTSERLKLFRQVCSAVHYAHQNLVIHRDLKPSNILVTPDGTPKLLDFGIAKLLNPGSDFRTMDATETEMRMMTPNYASPEQVRGEPITTVSDVYALGVLLYELLTGHRPYHLKSRAPHEVLKAVLEEVPEKPSTAITRQEEASSTDGTNSVRLTAELVSKTRDGQPDRLRRRLKGDIDNIVLMALRKEPQRRYLSVEQFSEDIRRHLEGLPVLARTATLSYRTGKFIKRNKLAVAATAIVLLTLIGGIVATAREARLANRRFNEVRKLAHSVLFDYHDAIANLPGSTPVRERLIKDALEYLNNLAQEAGNDRLLQREIANAYRKIGQIQGNSYYSNLGDTDGAMVSYSKSLAICERLSASDSLDRETQNELANSHIGMGDMHYGLNDLNSGLQEYERARVICEALILQEPANLEYRRALADLYTKIGDIKGMEGYPNLGDTIGASESYNKAIAMQEVLVAGDPENLELRLFLAKTLSNAGMILNTSGDVRGAIENGSRAVSLFEVIAAADPINVNYRMSLLSAYATLRYALVDNKQIAEAIQNSRKIIAGLEILIAADPQNVFVRRSLGVSHNALGQDLLRTGDVNGALENHRKAIAIAEALSATDLSSAENKQDLAFSWRRLADGQVAARDFHAALENFRKALKMREEILASDPSNVGTKEDISSIYAGISTALAAISDTKGAMVALQKSLSLAEEMSAQSPKNAYQRVQVALRYFEMGKLQSEIAHSRRESKPQQKARLLESHTWLQRSLGVWLELREQKKLRPADADKPDQVSHAIARCDAALARLP